MAARSVKQLRREWFRGHSRIVRLAAFVAVVAGIVVIVAVVFWAGFVGGARNEQRNGGGDHHGAMMQDGPEREPVARMR